MKKKALQYGDVLESPREVRELITQFRDNLCALLKAEEKKTSNLTSKEYTLLCKFKARLLKDFATIDGFNTVNSLTLKLLSCTKDQRGTKKRLIRANCED